MKKNITQIVWVLIFVLSLTSCVNYRYTDYGRPFDFLTAKNTFQPSGKMTLDTAAFRDIEVMDSASAIQLVGDQNAEKDTFLKEGEVMICNQYAPKLEESQIQNFKAPLIANFKNTQKIDPQGKKHLRQQNEVTSFRPIEHISWGEGFWSKFIKWLLIGLLVAALFVGLIIGIYFLVLWIGGPIAAVIVLVLILIALEVFFDIDLSWLANLF